MKVFIVHYKKLTSRKQKIIEQFNTLGITDYEFIEHYDRDDLNNSDMFIFEKDFNKSQIAIALSHIYAYKQICEKYDCALILEDDVILHPDFINLFNKYMDEIYKDFDMLFIGNGCNLHIPSHLIIPGKYTYLKGNEKTEWGGEGATRCSDSYVISKKCAKKIIDYINNISYKINLPVDWWLNTVIKDNNFSVYWSEPTIATQGSQIGVYNSSH